MACASLHIAGKVEDDYIRLRDLINVSLTTLKGTKDPPELDSEYYATREAIVEAELFLLRMINFKVWCWLFKEGSDVIMSLSTLPENGKKNNVTNADEFGNL